MRIPHILACLASGVAICRSVSIGTRDTGEHQLENDIVLDPGFAALTE
jgi:hypothetical protein